jgi:hypothetical protein
MSREEIEEHVMSQMPRTEQEGALQLGEDLNIAPCISLPPSGTKALAGGPRPKMICTRIGKEKKSISQVNIVLSHWKLPCKC